MGYEINLTSARAALHEAAALIRSLPVSLETRKIVRENLFGSDDSRDRLITIRSEVTRATDGTYGTNVFYVPTNGLLGVIAALRAGNWECLKDHDSFAAALDSLESEHTGESSSVLSENA